jgi:hypothetical protein
MMTFVPGAEDGQKSGFCQGDSGGPVFVGRLRGCKAADRELASNGVDVIEAEARPHKIQGAVSFNVLGLPSSAANASFNMFNASKCINASEMGMQDLTTPEHKSWVCKVTGQSAGGCSAQ